MKVTVIGLGHAGIVASVGLAAAGHDVLGVDVDTQRVHTLRSGETPVYEPDLDCGLNAALKTGNLRFAYCGDVDESLGDIALIATGTPSAVGGAADLHQVRSALKWVKTRAARGLVVVMKSTVPPGTGQRITDEDLRGSGIRYVSNPEFLREGSAVQDWNVPDRVVVGVEPNDHLSVALLKEMYAGIEAPYLVTDITSAEMIKYASNAFLATRISFVNEIALLCDRVGASIDDVSDGLALDGRTGARIHAGVGYGGSCFSKDLRALDYLALTNGVNVELLQSVMNVNKRQRLLPFYALQERFSAALAGLTIGVLGLAFKPETDDVRDAPALDLIRQLIDEGVRVRVYDPRCTEVSRRRLPPSVEYAPNPVEAAEQAQALVLVTEWTDIVNADWEAVSHRMLPPRFVFDGRNALDSSMLSKLGFEYTGVGRNVSQPCGDDLPRQRELLSHV